MKIKTASLNPVKKRATAHKMMRFALFSLMFTCLCFVGEIAMTPSAASLLTSVAAVMTTTSLTVSLTNLQGWQIQRTTSGLTPTPTPTPDVVFVNGPSTPPLGTGNAEFRIGPDGGAAAQLRHPGYAGTRLPNPNSTQPSAANELSVLSYSTFVQQDGSGGQAPYIILQIDTDGDAGIEDLLFFEPVYQSATFCPSNPQPALVTGQWQTWDAFNGCWYSVFGTTGSGPGRNTVPLRTLSAALPTGQIANSSPSGLGGVRLVTGFGAGAYDNFIGNADAFRIGVGADDTIYNFEAAPTAAGVTITGRVLNAQNRGVSKARVFITGTSGETRFTTTNPFGFYHFQDIAVGDTYVFKVQHKQYQFEPQVLTVFEQLENLNFAVQP